MQPLLLWLALSQAFQQTTSLDDLLLTPERIGVEAYQCMEAPESVTVQLVLDRRAESPGSVLPSGCVPYGSPGALSTALWRRIWNEAKTTTEGDRQRAMKRCGFHPDRLVTLQKGSTRVEIVKCHRCDAVVVVVNGKALPGVTYLKAVSRQNLDYGLDSEDVRLHPLADYLGPEVLSACLKPMRVELRLVWINASYAPRVEPPSPGETQWKPVSPGFVHGLVLAIGRDIEWQDLALPPLRSARGLADNARLETRIITATGEEVLLHVSPGAAFYRNAPGEGRGAIQLRQTNPILLLAEAELGSVPVWAVRKADG